MKTTLKQFSLAMLTFGSLGLAATSAHADWGHGSNDYGYGPRHDDGLFRQSQAFGQQVAMRQARQRDRIRIGMQEGSLTRHEFRKLMEEQREIHEMERHFRADGILDVREFRRLDHALDVASRNIRMEKHDRQARYAAYDTTRFDLRDGGAWY